MKNAVFEPPGRGWPHLVFVMNGKHLLGIPGVPPVRRVLRKVVNVIELLNRRSGLRVGVLVLSSVIVVALYLVGVWRLARMSGTTD